MKKFNMNKTSRHSECKDCKGLGWILLTDKENYTQCIICNSTGTTTHDSSGMNQEAEKSLLFMSHHTFYMCFALTATKKFFQ